MVVMMVMVRVVVVLVVRRVQVVRRVALIVVRVMAGNGCRCGGCGSGCQRVVMMVCKGVVLIVCL